MYQYRVIVRNSIGSAESEWINLKTDEAVPFGLAPPHWYTSSDAPNQIFLKWSMPEKPNGDELNDLHRLQLLQR